MKIFMNRRIAITIDGIVTDMEFTRDVIVNGETAVCHLGNATIAVKFLTLCLVKWDEKAGNPIFAPTWTNVDNVSRETLEKARFSSKREYFVTTRKVSG